MKINDLAPIAIALVVAIIVLVVGSLIITELHSDQTTTESINIANESMTVANNTAQQISYFPITTLTVYNGSTSLNLMSASNYTLTESTGIINFTNQVAGLTLQGQSVNLTYTYTRDAATASYNASSKGLEGVSNLTGQLPLLATVVIFAVILAVVIGFFGSSIGGGRRREQGPGGREI